MLNAEQKKQLRAFYNTLKDQPLEPSDDYYVPFLEKRASLNHEDPIAELTTRISWSDSESVNLLTGQRGSGKSTELRRLKRNLEQDDCRVFLCDVHDYMNLNKAVDVTDFLVSIMGALGELVAEHYQKNPGDRGFFERIVDWLNTEVEIPEFTIKSGFVDIKASLRDDPSFKQRLQENLRGHVAALVKQAQEFSREVVSFVRKQDGDNDKKVVLIVDSLEQLRGVGSEADQVHKSVANLFSTHGDSLRLPTLHIVYTIPPYLIPLSPGLGGRLGGGMVCNLPSVHVRDRKGEPDENGLAIMESIIRQRKPDWENIFVRDELLDLAVASGGDLRDYFRLLRQCLVKASNTAESELPLPQAISEQAKNHLRREMLPIAENDKQWLRKIAETNEAKLDSIDDLPQLARFFDSKLVLNYRNSDDWYHIHPLLISEVGDRTA